jgi:hypothetical protein
MGARNGARCMVMRRMQPLEAPIEPSKGQRRECLCTRLHKTAGGFAAPFTSATLMMGS